jgi:glycosyltransferase involved in cell wall biosynthesis
VPCAATNVGDSSLIVADTGLTIPPDDAAALAGAWRTLVDMPPDVRGELGQRARERVLEKYRIELSAGRIWTLYRELWAPSRSV